MALMAEAHHAESAEAGEQSADDLVDIEHMVKEDLRRPRRTTKK
jgi:hypothetical protein